MKCPFVLYTLLAISRVPCVPRRMERAHGARRKWWTKRNKKKRNVMFHALYVFLSTQCNNLDVSRNAAECCKYIPWAHTVNLRVERSGLLAQQRGHDNIKTERAVRPKANPSVWFHHVVGPTVYRFLLYSFPSPHYPKDLPNPAGNMTHELNDLLSLFLCSKCYATFINSPGLHIFSYR